MPLYKQSLSLKEASKDAVIAALIKRRQSHKKTNFNIASLCEINFTLAFDKRVHVYSYF